MNMDNHSEINEDVLESNRNKSSNHYDAIGPIRTVLPQFIACFAKNLLLFNLGIAVSFPTIVVPVLRGLQAGRNPDETLSFTDEQSSWYASIAFLSTTIGSLLSGILTDQLGRRRAMILVNVPFIVAFLLLAFAGSLRQLYLAALLLGLGVGFMEAPVITYVSEISQPSVRGILLAFANIAAQCGVFTLYLLGSLRLWRHAALICILFPVLAMVAVYFIPETPCWLLSRNRRADALQSLQWLRGWVSPQHVDKEFTEITRYMDQTRKRCDSCQNTDSIMCQHSVSRLKLWQDMLLPSTYRPFLLTMLVFMTCQFNGLVSIRPYLVQIFQTFGFPLDPNWASVVLGCLDIIANTICVLIVRSIGKRWIFLISIFGCSTFCFILGANAIATLPPGTSSFDKTAINKASDNYIALGSFLFLALFAGMGNGIPWMCLSEIFPFRVRGLATGITSACSYLFSFAATKSYLSLEHSLAMSGSFLFYGAFGAMGFVLHFFIFPETEGRTLEEIEVYFSDTNRSVTDRHIRRFTKATNHEEIDQSLELTAI